MRPSKSRATLKVPRYSESPMLLSKSHATLKAPCYSQSPMLLSKSHATLKVPCYSQSPMLLSKSSWKRGRGKGGQPAKVPAINLSTIKFSIIQAGIPKHSIEVRPIPDSSDQNPRGGGKVPGPLRPWAPRARAHEPKGPGTLPLLLGLGLSCPG